MGWFSRYQRRKRRAQEAADATRPLSELLRRRGFGRGRSERTVEIPWVLDRVHAPAGILDIGFAHAPPEYLDGLRARCAPGQLYGVDLLPKHQAGMRTCVGDLRALPYADETFDIVILISTLEHVGMDNTRYTVGVERRPGTQAEALREVRRVLRPGGRALVTVPFGKYEDHGWFVNYDRALWESVVRGSGLTTDVCETFGYLGRCWRAASEEELAAVGYRSNGARGAAGVLCAVLRRDQSAG